jgi:hypothetical protein
VTDVTDCDRVTTSAIERIDDVVGQLDQFGLSREVRVVSESTPERVRRTFDRVRTDREVAVDVVDAEDELSPVSPEKATS